MAAKNGKTVEANRAETELSNDGETAIVLSTSQNTAVIGGALFKMKKRISLSLLKHPAGTSVFVKFETKFYESKKVKAEPGKAELPAATVANVIDLTTGEEMLYIISSVLGSTLREEYANDGYVGKCFAINKVAPDASKGKRYATFSVAEIEPTGE